MAADLFAEGVSFRDPEAYLQSPLPELPPIDPLFDLDLSGIEIYTDLPPLDTEPHFYSPQPELPPLEPLLDLDYLSSALDKGLLATEDISGIDVYTELPPFDTKDYLETPLPELPPLGPLFGLGFLPSACDEISLPEEDLSGIDIYTDLPPLDWTAKYTFSHDEPALSDEELSEIDYRTVFHAMESEHEVVESGPSNFTQDLTNQMMGEPRPTHQRRPSGTKLQQVFEDGNDNTEELFKMLSQSEVEKTTLADEKHELEEQIRELAEERAKLQKESKKLRRDNQELSDDIVGMELDVKRFMDQNNDLLAERAEWRQSKEGWQQEMQGWQREREAWQQARESLEQTIATLRKELQDSQQKAAENARPAEREKHDASIQTHSVEDDHCCDAVQNQLANLTSEVAAIKHVLANQPHQCASVSELATLKTALDEERRQRESLAGDHAKLKTQSDAANGKLTELDEALAHERRQHVAAKDELKSLKDVRAEELRQKQFTKEETASTNKILLEERRQRVVAEEELAAARATIADAQRARDESASALAEADQAREAADHERDEARRERDTAIHARDEAQRQRHAARRECDEARAEPPRGEPTASLHSQDAGPIQERRAELQRLVGLMDAAQPATADRRAEVKDLRAKVHVLKEAQAAWAREREELVHALFVAWGRAEVGELDVTVDGKKKKMVGYRYKYV